jgi:hypothetical protein
MSGQNKASSRLPRLSDEAVARIEQESGGDWNEEIWEALARFLIETKEGRDILVALISIWHPPPA